MGLGKWIGLPGSGLTTLTTDYRYRRGKRSLNGRDCPSSFEPSNTETGRVPVGYCPLHPMFYSQGKGVPPCLDITAITRSQKTPSPVRIQNRLLSNYEKRKRKG